MNISTLKKLIPTRRNRVINRMINHFKNKKEETILSESWVSKRILDGQTNRREELIKLQMEIKEVEMFLEFLKSL